MHLQSSGVDGLATANLDDALLARRAGVSLPIVMYGSALPGGLEVLVANDLTPSVWTPRRSPRSRGSRRRRTGRCRAREGRRGLGRLGVRLDEAAAFSRSVIAAPGSAARGDLHAPAVRRRLRAPRGRAGGSRSTRRSSAGSRRSTASRSRSREAAASSILSAALPDSLTTIAPGHLLYGLSPLAGHAAEELGFRKAVAALRGRLIHVGSAVAATTSCAPGRAALAADSTVGVVLIGMDNGYRAAAGGDAFMLCRGLRCPVLGVPPSTR